MSDQPNRIPPGQSQPPGANSDHGFSAGNLPVTIMAQYIKDLSFENPNAPDTLRQSQGRPVMDANFSMDARKLEWEGRDNIYEVVLGLQTAARKGDQTAFMCEIQYGMVVDLTGVPEEQHHPMLLIEMPRYAFPFVRQIVADLTQQGGYQPLLLAPADFRGFYIQRFGDEIKRAVAGTA